jgi:hypothetical protein
MIDRKTDNIVIPRKDLDRVVNKILDLRVKHPAENIMITKFKETGQIVVWTANSKSNRKSA